MTRIKKIASLGCIVAIVVAVTMGLAWADESGKGQKIVDNMTTAFNHLNADPDMGWFRDNLKHATGVLLLTDS